MNRRNFFSSLAGAVAAVATGSLWRRKPEPLFARGGIVNAPFAVIGNGDREGFIPLAEIPDVTVQVRGVSAASYRRHLADAVHQQLFPRA